MRSDNIGSKGIVAKRGASLYRSGERCGDWLKWPANRGQEFVIGGYISNDNVVATIFVGYYEDSDLIYASRVFEPASQQHSGGSCWRISKTSKSRDVLLINLPERSEGQWGVGLTAAKMHMCRWLTLSLLYESSFWSGLRKIYCVMRGSPKSATTKMRAK